LAGAAFFFTAVVFAVPADFVFPEVFFMTWGSDALLFFFESHKSMNPIFTKANPNKLFF
jgi:hypothetical protein